MQTSLIAGKSLYKENQQPIFIIEAGSTTIESVIIKKNDNE